MYLFACFHFAVEKVQKAFGNTDMYDFWSSLETTIMVISQDQGQGQLCGRAGHVSSSPHHPLGVLGLHDGMQPMVEGRERAWHRARKNERELAAASVQLTLTSFCTNTLELPDNR